MSPAVWRCDTAEPVSEVISKAYKFCRFKRLGHNPDILLKEARNHPCYFAWG
jgi:hypothetical protein